MRTPTKSRSRAQAAPAGTEPPQLTTPPRWRLFGLYLVVGAILVGIYLLIQAVVSGVSGRDLLGSVGFIALWAAASAVFSDR